MLEILGMIFFTGGALLMLYIAAFATTLDQRLAAFIGAIIYGIVGFMLVEAVSMDIRKKKNNKTTVIGLALAGFALNFYALWSYTNSIVPPLFLLGPSLLLALWVLFKVK
ncbi:hypothetical protein A3L04_09245 [Thermococcus chitonophagus]|uniref:Uncharacterized protein n=1 Tax=Thermococcus chitonophagus TaxID=54262 RepID=A0A160VS73_9EURY|nr:hypothetical protein [Thermococcus chitonophagus]ASJ17238.1 hypothetical protein A3L04_09245 [Thermococcus chitonophagus]CUX77857.1 hypothetical protein CHITON_1078 [Thermococcus chitonophagus]